VERLRERFKELVQRRCERFRVRDFRGIHVIVAKFVKTGIQGPNCPHPSSSFSDDGENDGEIMERVG